MPVLSAVAGAGEENEGVRNLRASYRCGSFSVVHAVPVLCAELM